MTLRIAGGVDDLEFAVPDEIALIARVALTDDDFAGRGVTDAHALGQVGHRPGREIAEQRRGLDEAPDGHALGCRFQFGPGVIVVDGLGEGGAVEPQQRHRRERHDGCRAAFRPGHDRDLAE